MKTKFLLLSTAILLVLFNSCSKYDDGPAFSLKSKKSRVAGNWELTEFTIDGINVMNNSTPGEIACFSGGTVNYTESTGISQWYWNFTSSGKLSYTATFVSKFIDYFTTADDCIARYDMESEMDYSEGFWAFEDDEKKLSIGIDGDPLAIDIVQLKEKEMKLEGNVDGQKYSMTFKKRK